MNNPIDSKQFGSQSIDYVASAVKSLVGAVPFAGSLLVEIAGNVIPNQRLDRLTRFALILDSRIKNLEQEYIRSQFSNEYFSDLLEEGLRQAARSLNDERREYIANLITNSLSQKDIEYFESKYLMRILNEVNDIEIVWLKFYLGIIFGGDKEFQENHAAILSPITATLGGPEKDLEKEALQTSYKDHLSQLGLLRPHFETDTKTHLPVYDRFTGGQKIRSYEITSLGRLFLRFLGLSNSD
jgi:hypothetical protein